MRFVSLGLRLTFGFEHDGTTCECSFVEGGK